MQEIRSVQKIRFNICICQIIQSYVFSAKLDDPVQDDINTENEFAAKLLNDEDWKQHEKKDGHIIYRQFKESPHVRVMWEEGSNFATSFPGNTSFTLVKEKDSLV